MYTHTLTHSILHTDSSTHIYTSKEIRSDMKLGLINPQKHTLKLAYQNTADYVYLVLLYTLYGAM